MKTSFILLILIVSNVNTKAQNSNFELGKAATETTVEIEIDAPIESVWEEFSNIGNIYLNSPTVSKSHTSSEKSSGIGASRHMEMSKMIKSGATLDERVIAWEEGSYQKLEVFKINHVAGIKTMGGDFLFIKKGNKTIIHSTLNYSMKNSLWGFMNRIMGKKKFSKVWKSVLAGYKYHIETGEEVTEQTRLDLSEVSLIDIVIQ